MTIAIVFAAALWVISFLVFHFAFRMTAWESTLAATLLLIAAIILMFIL